MIVIVNFVAPLLNFREILFALSWTCIGRLWGCCTDFRYLKGKSGWISGMAATIKKEKNYVGADIVCLALSQAFVSLWRRKISTRRPGE